MERVRGIEPPCSAWEADILPLNYTRINFYSVKRIIIQPWKKSKCFFLPPLPLLLHILQSFIRILQFTLFTSPSQLAIIYNRNRKKRCNTVRDRQQTTDVDDMIYGDAPAAPSQR